MAQNLWQSVGCSSPRPLLNCGLTSTYETTATRADFAGSIHLKGSRHSSCSLVGSSSNLKNHKRGREIDSRGIIIRVNNPPLKGFTPYVGNRTADILFINDQLTRCEFSNNHKTLYIRPVYRLLANASILVKRCHLERGQIKLYSVSGYIEKSVRQILYGYAETYKVTHKRRYWPSSGFRALFFSRMICKRVHVYGFGMEGAKTLHYYSRRQKYTLPSYHDFSLETRIINDIANGKFNNTIFDFSWRGFGTVIVHY